MPRDPLRLALGVLLYAATCTACQPSPRPQDTQADTGCVIRGTLLRDTVIGADTDSLTVIVGTGMSLRLKHAIDYRAPVIFPGDVLSIRCHAAGRRARGMTVVDTIVDSLDVIFRPDTAITRDTSTHQGG
jgi:hypothetical protein